MNVSNGSTVYVDFHVVVCLSSVTNPSHRVGGAVTVVWGCGGHGDCPPIPAAAAPRQVPCPPPAPGCWLMRTGCSPNTLRVVRLEGHNDDDSEIPPTCPIRSAVACTFPGQPRTNSTLVPPRPVVLSVASVAAPRLRAFPCPVHCDRALCEGDSVFRVGKITTQRVFYFSGELLWERNLESHHPSQLFTGV